MLADTTADVLMPMWKRPLSSKFTCSSSALTQLNYARIDARGARFVHPSFNKNSIVFACIRNSTVRLIWRLGKKRYSNRLRTDYRMHLSPQWWKGAALLSSNIVQQSRPAVTMSLSLSPVHWQLRPVLVVRQRGNSWNAGHKSSSFQWDVEDGGALDACVLTKRLCAV